MNATFAAAALSIATAFHPAAHAEHRRDDRPQAVIVQPAVARAVIVQPAPVFARRDEGRANMRDERRVERTVIVRHGERRDEGRAIPARHLEHGRVRFETGRR